MDLRRPPVLLLDDRRTDQGRCASLLFTRPREIIAAYSREEVLPALEALDAALASGFYAAGWIAFEAAAAFESRLDRALRSDPPEPLVWFAVSSAPQRLSERQVFDRIAAAMGGTSRRGRIRERRFADGPEAYRAKLAQIQEAIAQGEVYQLNYTFPVALEREGDPLALYARLRSAQPVEFSAYIDTGATRVLSLSPELFMRSRQGRLEARPMKGTARRGVDAGEDAALAQGLQADAKTRAENLMIVDLLRNDFARIAAPGSVGVDRLFAVETYKTVLQMTSTVTAKRPPATPLSTILRALFPCGSVTGAPKIRAMELIGALEPEPRGVYTGAIGWAGPSGDFCFSVPIRTVIEHAGAGIRYGVGSGIVADSQPDAEYRECQIKTRFLDSRPEDPALIETIGWTPEDGYRYLAGHLARLADSARYFGYPFDCAGLRARLSALAADLSGPSKLRVLLGPSGAISITAERLEPWPEPVALALARLPAAAKAPLLRHKTSHRAHYETPLGAARARVGAGEVALINARGELCDGARSTLFLQYDGALLTPARHAGALPGVLRRMLLRAGRAAEAVLTPADLIAAEAVYLGNAARGLARAHLLETQPPGDEARLDS